MAWPKSPLTVRRFCAFRPQTIIELIEAFSLARENEDVGVIILTGEARRLFAQVVISTFAVMTAILGMINWPKRYWPIECFRSSSTDSSYT